MQNSIINLYKHTESGRIVALIDRSALMKCDEKFYNAVILKVVGHSPEGITKHAVIPSSEFATDYELLGQLRV